MLKNGARDSKKGGRIGKEVCSNKKGNLKRIQKHSGKRFFYEKRGGKFCIVSRGKGKKRMTFALLSRRREKEKQGGCF